MYVFSVPIFFIVFRETLETGIIVAILLSFLKQNIGGSDRDPAIYRKLRKQVWVGTGSSLLLCIIAGCGLIGAFYSLNVNGWGIAEEIWEGVFSLLASLIISIMGIALLRVSKLQEKWRIKLALALATHGRTSTDTATTRFKRFCEKYAMFILPFITVLREGLEAVVFIGGVSLGLPASAIPISAITALLAGCLVSYLIYKGGNMAPIQVFLIISTCVLYLVGAGLFTRCVAYFEAYKWNHMTGGDSSEGGTGPGSYNIHTSVWHVNCCGTDVSTGGGGWAIFNAILGWSNSASYGTVISYNMYWIAVIVGFLSLLYREQKGHWPLMKKSATVNQDSDSETPKGPEEPLQLPALEETDKSATAKAVAA
ncbi:Iron permease FTR1/Fip1/EfeU [Elaphomyces granulatus]